MNCFFDIEADNLLTTATTVWCIVAKVDDHYHIWYDFSDGKIRTLPTNATAWDDLYDYLSFISEHTLVGHNIISYDLPLLKKLYNFEYKIDPNKIVDTHIQSRLFYPDREEHSLEYFGRLLSNHKGNHQDWTKFSQEMLDYCIRDVDLTEKVYHYLQQEARDWDWSEALKLEYNIWHIQQKQEQYGVLLDQSNAEKLLEKIQEEINALESTIIQEIPLVCKNDGELKKIFLKNGEYTTFVQEWINGN